MQRRSAAIFAALLALCLASPTAAMPHLDVPLEHWSYEFLDRLVVRAELGRTFLDLRPLTRGEMAAVVSRVAAAARAGSWTPTAIEAQQVEMLRLEFSEELPAFGDTLPVYETAYHVWGGDEWRLQAFYAGRERIDAGTSNPGEASQVDARLILEPAAALEIGAHLLAAVQVFYRVRTGTGSFVNSTNPADGEAEFVFEPSDRFSIIRSVDPTVRYAREHWRLDLSRTRLRWGPGRANAMLLQGANPPLDVLRLQVALGPVRWTSLAGQLRPARLSPSDPVLTEKYLAAHRLEFGTPSRLQLAISEALIYGDRGLDLAYLNPLAVLFVTQTNLGDTDNALVSIDGSWRVTTGLQLYGECVIDDLNLRRGLDHFGNKFGVLAGLRWFEPFGAGDWDVDAEYSWASLYTYTHHTAIDRYEHYGVSLGSRTGPDSDLWAVGLNRRLSRGWAARAFYELERFGEGSLAVGDDQRATETQDYLNGVIESRHQPGFALRYRGLRSFELAAEYRQQIVVQPQHDAQVGRLIEPAFRLETRLEF